MPRLVQPERSAILSPMGRSTESADRSRWRRRAAFFTAALLLLAAAPAQAYIGPGAGFALLSSFAVLFTTLVLALVSALLWPFRTAWRVLRRRRAARPRIRRLVVVGFDGQDPRLTDRMLAEGKLPNFRRLADMGGYHRLATTFPSLSPVAWSSFSTGTNPARHNIFDFLDRDLRSYLPRLSSTHIGHVHRELKLGRWRIPLARPELRLLRKSRPFWSILGDHSIWSSVLRVPITFPPDRFYGAQLSAMCVPDLLGTQGTFLLLTTRRDGGRYREGGMRVALERDGAVLRAILPGPENTLLKGHPAMGTPLEIEPGQGRARVRLGGTELELEPRVLSGWQRVRFRAAPGITVAGLTRMMLTELGDEVSLYLSPLNLDPAKPAMPISHPSYYSAYLEKRIGPYATLGIAEDTWALNEGVIDDATFLELTHDIDSEREAMLMAVLDRQRRGCVVCVFDATDRIQHMFWRDIDPGHPAAEGRNGGPNAIEELYRRNDERVGRLLDRLRPGDLLMVLSDHGFTSFRRGINLNAWLLANGYLALKPGADGSGEWLHDVDWTRTRAYSLGLTGLFLNLAGREGSGVVVSGAEANALKDEIVGRLSGLVDPDSGTVAINEVFDTARLYTGPYLSQAPDLIVGYNHGYRISWDGASGVVTGPVFSDNTQPWSGDHCVDPRIVPGVLFTSVPIEGDSPALIDIAPTALDLFGIRPPDWVEGRALYAGRAFDGERVA